MFYFTYNESKIYESFTFWNKLQEKNELFHDILIYWDAPVVLSESVCNSVPQMCHKFSEKIKRFCLTELSCSFCCFNV